MYYSLWDDQLEQVRSFAFNLESKEEVREALVHYLLLGNFSEEGEESIKANSLEELCEYYGFTLIVSENPICESYEM